MAQKRKAAATARSKIAASKKRKPAAKKKPVKKAVVKKAPAKKTPAKKTPAATRSRQSRKPAATPTPTRRNASRASRSSSKAEEPPSTRAASKRSTARSVKTPEKKKPPVKKAVSKKTPAKKSVKKTPKQSSRSKRKSVGRGARGGVRALRNRRDLHDPIKNDDYVDPDVVTLSTWFSKPAADSEEEREFDDAEESDGQNFAEMSDYEDDVRDSFDIPIEGPSEPESDFDEREAWSSDDELNVSQFSRYSDIPPPPPPPPLPRSAPRGGNSSSRRAPARGKSYRMDQDFDYE